MKTFNNYFFDNFLIEKEINEGLTKNTILTYYSVFNNFIGNEFINIEDPKTFTEINFKRYLGDMYIKNKWTSHTYNRNRKNLKVFCDFLVKENYLLENPLKNIKQRKIDKCLPKFYTKEQVSLILYLIQHLFIGDTYIFNRNKTILYTYLYTGIRLSELIKLKIEDINFSSGYIQILGGKGGKDRVIPIIDKLDRILFKYLNNRLKQDFKNNNSILFPTRLGGFLQHRDIYNILDKLRKKLDFKLTIHMFRHTFATELARNNVNIFNIASLLGHSKIDTTKIYLNFNTDSMKETMNGLNLFSQ